ncbi:hypothetical protein B9G55_15285 [Saccharibacillus sp. O16]|nr:hypothetical protein B9G55_15285 [Saccharibacillus sp. O16]
MLKLLKYDMKRDLFTLLGGAAALVLGLLAIELLGKQVGMERGAQAVLSLMGYTFFGILILIAVCNSFRLNIRSVGRRLVPLGSLHYVGSALLYGLLLNGVLLVIGGLHMLYYQATGILQQLEQSGSFTINWDSSIPLPFGVSLIVLWGSLFLLTLLLLVMAMMESMRFKGRTLIAVAAVIGISILTSAVENSFFGGAGTQALTGFQIESQSELNLPTESLGAVLPAFLFELVMSALFTWVTVKLINRSVRVE